MTINGVGPSPSSTALDNYQQRIADNLARLSSGEKLQSAADGAAALAAYNELEAAIGSHEQAGDNISYGADLASMADSAISNQSQILTRMRELAVQSGNGTLDPSSRTAIENEFSALRDELDRVSSTTEFNGTPLLQGDNIEIQAGIDSSSASRIEIPLPDTQATSLGLDQITLNTQSGAQDALTTIDDAIGTLGNAQAALGATSNRLEFADSVNTTMQINKAESASAIGEADFAETISDNVANQYLTKMAIRGLEIENETRGSLVNLFA